MTDAAVSWLLYACRSAYAAEVAEIVWRRDQVVRALVDNVDGDRVESDIAPVLEPKALADGLLDLPVVIPLLTPGYRRDAEAEARSHGLHHFPALADPTSVLASSATLDEGTVVNAVAVIGSNTQIGRFVHVNRTASIAHDDVIGDYATVGPGAVLAGSVTVGVGAFIGAGVVCAPEVTIGANAVVGAGSVVVKEVGPGTVVVGNPARTIRTGTMGYRNAGVGFKQ
jgi:sugar O-acyltransferase (sialic acid O-acetyltransferase NeuD family)